MKLTLNQTINTEALKQKLQTNFPDYKVGHAPLNKKTIRITNGMSQVVVGQVKNQQLICVGNINMTDIRFLIPFVIGIALFFITGLVFMVIMMQVKKKEYKAMEAEIGTYLQATIPN